MLTHTVTSEEDGLVLLTFLKNRLSMSRGTILRLKAREDGILLNGKHVTVRAVLHAGDVLTLATEDRAEDQNAAILPVSLPLSVLYEDESICLCDKPSGMPTHPSYRHREDTLANALAYRYRDTPFVFRAVNRLDRETSGVVLTARSSYAAARLSEELRLGRIQKEYLAIVLGEAPPEGEIALSIRRARDTIMLREVCQKEDEGAKDALTRFWRIAIFDGMSLVRVTPITGRTHQIRLHMASIGHPLLGDELYGTPSSFIKRCALHAYRLSFVHPMTGDARSFAAPLPDDMLSLLPKEIALSL